MTSPSTQRNLDHKFDLSLLLGVLVTTLHLTIKRVVLNFVLLFGLHYLMKDSKRLRIQFKQCGIKKINLII